MKKIIFILTILISVAVIILLFVVFSALQGKAPSQNELILPTQVPIIPVHLNSIPPSTNTIPTTGPSQINLSAQATQESIQAINLLDGFLPYNNSFTSSTGIPVQIYIPGKNQQERTWTLQIQTLGINFQIATQDPKYTSMRQSFREAAQIVFAFLDSHNVNPSTIFITWGDRAYEQETAEKWLQN